MASNAELYWGGDEYISWKNLNGLQTSGSWTLTGDTLFSAVVSTTGNILGLGTLNHLSGAGGGAATGVLTLSSNGTPQLVLNDLDAANAQEPMWYFQSANNASKGILYMGYGDRSSGTTMTGYTDVMVVDASSFTLGSTIGAGTQNFHAGYVEIDGNKKTSNLLEVINDDDGAVGDSSFVVTKLGGFIANGASDVVGALTAGTIASDATVIATTTMTTGANAGTSGQLNFIASDNDQGNIAINTSDQITFNAAGGGYWFDGKAGFGITPTAFVDIFGNKTASNLLYVSNDANATKDSTVVVTPTGWVGIGTTPAEKLDVVGRMMIIGSDHSAVTIRTNNTMKSGRLGMAHYATSEEPLGLINGTIYSNSVAEVYIGGGTSSNNAATVIRFFTAANATTITGTERMAIDNAGNVGIGTATPFHLLSSYKATPVWALTNTTVNKNVTSAAQAIDSSAIAFDISGEPTIKGRASNGDASNIAWNTSDQITFNAASGGYLFDAVTIAPVVAVSSTDTASGTYPIGSMFVRITASDTSMWVKIRMTGVLSARWKKLTP